MKRRPSLLKKIWRKLRGAESQPASKPASEPPPKRASSLEPLEGRIAPAALINPTTLMYKDIDGDIVTVKFSKQIFKTAGAQPNVAALANQIFKFSSGDNAVLGTGFTAFDPATAVGEQLQLIDLTKAPSPAATGNVAQGTAITITALTGMLNDVSGDGFAHIGHVNANSLGLGAVSIAGDLGQIDAGGGGVKTAIASLKVQSLGVKGLATQITASASLVSNIVGALGSLNVAGDVKDASIRVINGTDAFGKLLAEARIGAITIGGSLIGTQAVAAASNSTGLIDSQGDIGAVKIGNSIVGGGGANSGGIFAGDDIASVTVLGHVTGFTGADSGVISAQGTLGSVKITGSVTGGGGARSGVIAAVTVGSVTIGESLVAGVGEASGVIASTLTMGAVKVKNIEGGPAGMGADSGGISAGGKLTSVIVTDTLHGGEAAHTGFIKSVTDIGAVNIGQILGAGGQNGGTVIAGGKIASLTVLHSVVGGGGASSGSVFAGFDAAFAGDIGAVKIGGKIEGGAGFNSGSIVATTGKIASVTIGSATSPGEVRIKGGAGDWSGSVFSVGGMGAVKIFGHVEGGGGDFSGAIVTRDFSTLLTERAGNLAAVTIAGHLQGGAGDNSGVISADSKLASVTVGALLGGDGTRSGAVLAGQGSTNPGNTGAINIKGGLTGGAGGQSGGIVAEGKIASVTIGGHATGGTIRAGDDIAALTFKQNVDGTTVSARGQALQGATKDVAIGKIAVTGSVANAQFLAGYNTALAAVNPDAQIGAVTVKGDWTASDLVAGVRDGGATGFGDAGDFAITGFDSAKIVSSIASIVIGGSVNGAVGEHFGFTAQKIGSFKAGGVALPLKAAVTGEVFELADPDDVTVREIAIPTLASMLARGTTTTMSGSIMNVGTLNAASSSPLITNGETSGVPFISGSLNLSTHVTTPMPPGADNSNPPPGDIVGMPSDLSNDGTLVLVPTRVQWVLA